MNMPEHRYGDNGMREQKYFEKNVQFNSSRCKLNRLFITVDISH